MSHMVLAALLAVAILGCQGFSAIPWRGPASTSEPAHAGRPTRCLPAAACNVEVVRPADEVVCSAVMRAKHWATRELWRGDLTALAALRPRCAGPARDARAAPASAWLCLPMHRPARDRHRARPAGAADQTDDDLLRRPGRQPGHPQIRGGSPLRKSPELNAGRRRPLSWRYVRTRPAALPRLRHTDAPGPPNARRRRPSRAAQLRMQRLRRGAHHRGAGAGLARPPASRAHRRSRGRGRPRPGQRGFDKFPFCANMAIQEYNKGRAPWTGLSPD